MTPVGFEPTPLRNGALSHRLRPLGQSVLGCRLTFVFSSFVTEPTQHSCAVSWVYNILAADTEASSLRCAQPCHSILQCTLLQNCTGTIPWHTLKLHPSLHCPCHVHAVAIEFHKTLGKHAHCPNTPAAHILKMRKLFLGFSPSFFLKSRPVVLDCGHTPGQHAQCLSIPATHI